MNILTLLIVLAALSIAPFILMLTTSFVKFSVVLSIIRSALGSQQIPPNPVVIGLAVALTVHVMAPVAVEIRQKVDQSTMNWNDLEAGDMQWQTLAQTLDATLDPLKRFLLKHAHPSDTMMFESFSARHADREMRQAPQCSLDILIPAFVLSELKEAFELGFLIFLPFMIVDMIVANVLQAMGMMMLSPTTISLPFKLLLFVVSDGWRMIVETLLRGYL